VANGLSSDNGDSMMSATSGFKWLDRVLQVSFEESYMYWVVGIVDAQNNDRFYAAYPYDDNMFQTFVTDVNSKKVKRYKSEATAKAQKTRLKKQLAPQFADTLFIRRYVQAEIVVKSSGE
jgi:hypothetical protein